MTDFTLHRISRTDQDHVGQFIVDRWGSEIVIAHGRIYKPAELAGFIALDQGDKEKWLGLVTYHVQDDQCEIITIDSLG